MYYVVLVCQLSSSSFFVNLFLDLQFVGFSLCTLTLVKVKMFPQDNNKKADRKNVDDDLTLKRCKAILRLLDLVSQQYVFAFSISSLLTSVKFVERRSLQSFLGEWSSLS